MAGQIRHATIQMAQQPLTINGLTRHARAMSDTACAAGLLPPTHVEMMAYVTALGMETSGEISVQIQLGRLPTVSSSVWELRELTEMETQVALFE